MAINDIDIDREKYRLVGQMLEHGQITKEQLIAFFNVAYHMGRASGYADGYNDAVSGKDRRVSARITTPGFTETENKS